MKQTFEQWMARATFPDGTMPVSSNIKLLMRMAYEAPEPKCDVAEKIATKLIRRAEYNERAFGDKAMLGAELRRQAKEILDEFGPANEAPPCTCCNDMAQAAAAFEDASRAGNMEDEQKHRERYMEILARHVTEKHGPANEAEKGGAN